MKKLFFFALILLAAVTFSTAFGCKKSTDTTDQAPAGSDTFYVKMNQTLPFPAGGFTIRLDSVLSDSRCPTNVDCVWEGRVESRFIFTKNGNANTDTLSNDPIPSSFWPDDKTTQFGFNIQLLEMIPHPENPGTIPQAEYVAKLLVKPE